MAFQMKKFIFFILSFYPSILGVTAVKDASVSFSGTQVTVDCGDHGTVGLRLNNGAGQPSPTVATGNLYTFTETYEDKNFEKYSCQRDSTTTVKFFIKAKVCDNCYELDGSLVVGAICGDLLITGGIILLVYLRGQRKSGPAPQKPTNARRTAGSSGGPPVPNQDYQALTEFTRSKDTYATVLHRTG